MSASTYHLKTVAFCFRSKRATSKMTSAINALLSDTDDDDEMQADTSQLLDEEENEKNNGKIYTSGLLKIPEG